MKAAKPLPRWADLVLLPLLNLALALGVAGLVVMGIGQDPGQVIGVLIQGAFGTERGLSYTLYYATTFVFTGLAVAVAFHGGLFNIGGEGQAILGGLGAGLAALWLSPHLGPWLMLPIMVLASAAAGMAWAFVPAYLQAYRGSHVVITTIMFNFLASSLLVYLLVNWLRPAGALAVESAEFAESARLPRMHTLLEGVDIEWASSPWNASVCLAVAAAVGVYLFLWRSRAGYRLRTVGHGHLGWAGWAGGHERGGGREWPPDAGFCGRCGFHRHCGGADGTQPPGGGGAGQCVVWRVVSGRCRGGV